MESVETLEKTTFCGRRFTRAQLARVQETVHTCPHLSRNELALTLCEHLDWTTPKGTYKVRSCLKLVEALEARGIICLPATRQKRASVHAAIPFQGPDAPIDTSLDALAPISLHPVTTAEDRALWRSYVESHHYLGYKRPIGAHLFYFVAAEARQQKLGCVSFSAAAAWALAPRDTWIGWDNQHREQLLQLVLYQNRFLIFPWVNVANLGSKILSLATKQVGDDWVRLHGYRPVLVETFVDTPTFSGASYRAANWHYLGDTQGRGHDPKHEQNKSRKAIFAYPLQADWRQCLTEGHRAVELKKRYRNDLQSSRTRSVGDAFVALWTEVTHILPEVAAQYDEQWRVRKRVIDSLILMLLIFRLVSSKNAQSYGTTIDDLWDSCDRLRISLPQKSSIAPSSFCAARTKLDASIFRCVNRRMLTAYAPESSPYRWRGHRLFAVEGTKINLPRTLVSGGYRTPNADAHDPQGLVSCLYEIRSRLPFDFDLVSHADARRCARKHLDALEANDVVVYDRGYYSYALLHHHSHTGIHAIFRLQDTSHSVIQDFSASTDADRVVTISPSAGSHTHIRKKHPDLNIVPLQMRLLKYELAGKTFCLGTTLLDRHQRYPIQDFMEVCHARWGVEELYTVSKRGVGIEDFHAKTARGVKQELFAHFVLITMNRLFANRADRDLNGADPPTPPPESTEPDPSTGGTPSIQTNFENCIHILQRSLEELLLLNHEMQTAVQRAFAANVRQYQTVRPGRSYPRQSFKPELRWRPAKEKRTQRKQDLAPAATA